MPNVGYTISFLSALEQRVEREGICPTVFVGTCTCPVLILIVLPTPTSGYRIAANIRRDSHYSSPFALKDH
ncbi:hypothetical protein WG66_012874 [Moniliophthora roreri]|nr:hypothetical protein WG66_012874 [Moniliophthora roreri]